LTQVLDRPVHGRLFFEQVIRENLDIGRPEDVRLIFNRKITSALRAVAPVRRNALRLLRLILRAVGHRQAPVGVAHDVAAEYLLGGPGRGQAAGHVQRCPSLQSVPR
jgi:hypothetical protein